MKKLEAHGIKDLAFEGLFSEQEWSERKRHIATLKNFAGASVAAARALAAIRDKKLYRPYKTLKEFCQRECGWTERRLFQVVAFGKVRQALPAGKRTMVQSERQARELKSVPPEKREEVLDAAVASGKVTAASIRQAAEIVLEEVEDVDTLGRIVPKDALPYWNRRGEAKDLLGLISMARVAIKALSETDLMWAGVNLNGVVLTLTVPTIALPRRCLRMYVPTARERSRMAAAVARVVAV
jgi:hypothetical protein